MMNYVTGAAGASREYREGEQCKNTFQYCFILLVLIDTQSIIVINAKNGGFCCRRTAFRFA